MKAKVRTKQYNNSTIKISGSKNSGLPAIAAGLLCDEMVILRNIPSISDIKTLIAIIQNLGYDITFFNNTVIINKANINVKKIMDPNIKKLRGSYYLLGSIIGNNDFVNFSFLYPGGCKFGNRPINYHLQAFKEMGLVIKATRKKILVYGQKRVSNHVLDYPSIGTTINIILSSVKTIGTTIIDNASIEPEVIDVCNLLNSMGANIKINERQIVITGVEYLHKTDYRIISDRIEACTYLILGAINNGIKITNIDTGLISSFTSLLSNIGFPLIINKKSIILKKDNTKLKPFSISLNPYPELPTDIGPLLCVLASTIPGTSTIIDNVYPERISHIKELRKLNINIIKDENKIIVSYSPIIKADTVCGHDLRCTAALLLACSLSSSFSTIEHIEYLFRGYENIYDKLKYLGIDFIISC